jgi:hypothetical protein
MTPANPLQVEITYQQARDILLVRTLGVINHDSMLTLFDASAEAAAKYDCRRFFLDHRASPLNLTASEILEVPDELQRHGVVDQKAAFLFNQIGNKERFLETSCLSRGLNAKVFSDPVHALLWLTFGAAQP